MSDFASDCPAIKRLTHILPDAVTETMDLLDHVQDPKLREELEGLRDAFYKASVILNRLSGPDEWLKDCGRPAGVISHLSTARGFPGLLSGAASNVVHPLPLAWGCRPLFCFRSPRARGTQSS